MVQSVRSIAWTDQEKLANALEIFYAHRDAQLLVTLNRHLLEYVKPHLTGVDRELCHHYLMQHYRTHCVTVQDWKDSL